MSGLTEEQTAELGTRYIIPVPTVTYSGYPKEVTFAVKDSEGQDVELIAQGTRIFVDDVDGYTVEYFIEHLEEQHSIGDASITVLDTAGPEIELPASAYSMTVEIGSYWGYDEADFDSAAYPLYVIGLVMADEVASMQS